MGKIWICVYRDTIENHEHDNNLAEILVNKRFAVQYFKERVAGGYAFPLTFDDWENSYCCDDTEDFYEYANKHGAIWDIRF